MKFNKKTPLLAFSISSVLLVGCSDSTNNVPAVVAPTTSAVAIQFAAQVGGANFTCGQTFTGVGTNGDDMKITDFRMYVHGAHIYDELTSETHNITLTQDAFQLDDVAMLDFENSDDSADCNGTPETNTTLRGEVTVSATVDLANAEVCFEVGVPFEKNHIDEATAASPLNASGMLWAWKVGRKYIRIDGVGDPAGTPEGFNLHLGAQGCAAASATEAPTAACSAPNTFEVCIANFDVVNSVIAVDPANVLMANDVSTNLSNGGTAKPGCQSFIDDDDCEEVFPRLGLDYSYGRSATGVASSFTGGQQLFKKQ